jgi:hypothetical protein
MFEVFLRRNEPFRAIGERLAREWGIGGYWKARGLDAGTAAVWARVTEHFKPKPGAVVPDVFDIRVAFGKSSPFNEFHTLLQQDLSFKYGDSAFAYANSMMGELWSYLCHQTAGERVYEVSNGLADLLARTELRGVHGSDLRLPYPSVYIGLPASANLKDTEGDFVQGFFVTQSVPADTDAPGKSWWILTVAAPANDAQAQTCFFFNIDLLDDEPVEEALDRKLKSVAAYPTGVRSAFSDGLGPSWKDQFRWVMNVVLYATHHPDAELTEYEANRAYTLLKARAEKAPKGSEKRRRLYEELRNLRPSRRILLGKSVQSETEASVGEPRPLRVRTLVAGHWRNQPHGTNRALRKLIWIRPFWRGPEDAPELNPRRVLAVPFKETA